MSMIALRYLSEPITGLTTQDDAVADCATATVVVPPLPPPPQPARNKTSPIVLIIKRIILPPRVFQCTRIITN